MWKNIYLCLYAIHGILENVLEHVKYKKFGYRLGSPDTYTRTFRKMKEDGDFKVRIHRYNKLSNFMNKKTDALWVLEDHNLWW